jgi:hypothetical protein
MMNSPSHREKLRIIDKRRRKRGEGREGKERR